MKLKSLQTKRAVVAILSALFIGNWAFSSDYIVIPTNRKSAAALDSIPDGTKVMIKGSAAEMM
jgi:hypothetical protein